MYVSLKLKQDEIKDKVLVIFSFFDTNGSFHILLSLVALKTDYKRSSTILSVAILTHHFFPEHETYFERVSEVQRLVDQLPEPNKRMLEMLTAHLEKVKLYTFSYFGRHSLSEKI